MHRLRLKTKNDCDTLDQVTACFDVCDLILSDTASVAVRLVALPTSTMFCDPGAASSCRSWCVRPPCAIRDQEVLLPHHDVHLVRQKREQGLGEQRQRQRNMRGRCDAHCNYTSTELVAARTPRVSNIIFKTKRITKTIQGTGWVIDDKIQSDRPLPAISSSDGHTRTLVPPSCPLCSIDSPIECAASLHPFCISRSLPIATPSDRFRRPSQTTNGFPTRHEFIRTTIQSHQCGSALVYAMRPTRTFRMAYRYRARHL